MSRPRKRKNQRGYQCPHPDCMYKGSGSPGNDRASCDYFAYTGRCRSTQPGGEDPATCKLYIPKGTNVERVKKARCEYEPRWENVAKAIYDAGHTDAAIAAAVGVHPSTIERWRHKRGLKGHRDHRGRFQSIDTEKAMELYKAGKTDKEISEALLCSTGTIRYWRRENGLKSFTSSGKPKVSADWDAAMRLYEKGLSDVKISKELGCSPQTVHRWRRRNNLPTKYLTKREEKKDG